MTLRMEQTYLCPSSPKLPLHLPRKLPALLRDYEPPDCSCLRPANVRWEIRSSWHAHWINCCWRSKECAYTASWWFHPSLKYKSTWIISQSRAEKKCLNPPTRPSFELMSSQTTLYLTCCVVSYRRRARFPPPLHQPGNSSEDQAWCPSEIDLQGQSWPVVGDLVDPT